MVKTLAINVIPSYPPDYKDSISGIRKYLKSKGWNLRIWVDWGDLVGATLYAIGTDVFVELNEYGKYSAGAKGSSMKKARLKAAQKAAWFAEKYLKPRES